MQESKPWLYVSENHRAPEWKMIETEENLPNFCLHPDPTGRPLRRFSAINCSGWDAIPEDLEPFFLGLPLGLFTGSAEGWSDSISGRCGEEDMEKETRIWVNQDRARNSKQQLQIGWT